MEISAMSVSVFHHLLFFTFTSREGALLRELMRVHASVKKTQKLVLKRIKFNTAFPEGVAFSSAVFNQKAELNQREKI